MKPDLTRCARRREINAWAIRTNHFHARERTDDSFACAREAMFAAQHLAALRGASS